MDFTASTGVRDRLTKTYRISCGGTIQNGISRTDLVAPNAFHAHLALYQLLIGSEVHAITSCLAQERNVLALEYAANPVCGVYLADRVPGTVV